MTGVCLMEGKQIWKQTRSENKALASNNISWWMSGPCKIHFYPKSVSVF